MNRGISRAVLVVAPVAGMSCGTPKGCWLCLPVTQEIATALPATAKAFAETSRASQ